MSDEGQGRKKLLLGPSTEVDQRLVRVRRGNSPHQQQTTEMVTGMCILISSQRFFYHCSVCTMLLTNCQLIIVHKIQLAAWRLNYVYM